MSLTRRCLDQLLLECRGRRAVRCVETGVGVSEPVLDNDRVIGVRLAGRRQGRVARADRHRR